MVFLCFSVSGSGFWCSCWVWCFVLMLTYGVILYYTIILLYIYYITIIIYYTILFPSISSSHIFSSSPSDLSSLISFHSIRVGTYIYLFIFSPSFLSLFPLLIYHSLPHPNIQSFWFKVYVSVLTYTYLYSFLFLLIQSFLSSSNILTPHVLSEWMVEVCRF